jgi:S1-C subfamily serine protease
MRFQAMICFFPLVLSSAMGMKPETIARNSFPSSVGIYLFDENKNPLKSGSGFFVKAGVIATNYHVINGASFGFAKIVGKDTEHELLNVVALNQRMDLALVGVSDTNAPVLSLGSNRKLTVGQKLYAIGNPQGLEGTFSEGIVSSIREVGSDYFIQMTTPISPGSSGGPVLDERGLVVGVSVATFQNGQNLNFAVPVTYLNQLVESSVENKISNVAQFNVAKSRGPSLFDLPMNNEPSEADSTRVKILNDKNPDLENDGADDVLIMSR